MELYINSSDYVNFDIIGGNTSGTPLAVLVRPGSLDIHLAVTYAITQPVDGERWQAYIPFSQTTVQGTFTVVWTATVGSETVSQSNLVEVISPYSTPDDASSRFGWTYSDPTLLNYKPYNQVKAAEKISRYIIDLVTKKTFGSTFKTLDAYGQQTDSLVLGEPIISFSKLWENSALVLDIANPDLKWIGNVEITETGTALRLVFPGYDIAESETKYVGSETGAFRQGYRYTVEGQFGFPDIPERVYESSLLLIYDYLCKDSTWREKYLNDIELRDWKYTFEPQAYRGTGNLLADQMLSEYFSPNMAVI